MIRVRVVLNEGRTDQVELTGHGGRARGRDIVCAAVSAVAETALAGLLHYGGDLVEWEIREGYLAIGFKAREPGICEPLDVILNTMLIGLREIARQYPGRVLIELEQNPGVSDKA